MRAHLLAAVACALAIAIAYGSALDGELVWDDVPLIQQDDRLRSLDRIGDIFGSDFFERSDESVKYGYYRPLVTFSYLIDRRLHGVSPRAFHLTNLVLHFACTLLVYALGLRVLRLSALGAFLAALLFAVHPVHTESVSWISGRTDVLATLFILGAWLLHDAAQTRKHGERWPLRAGAVVCFMAALLCKELAIALPLILIAMRAMDAREQRTPRVLLLEVAPYLAAAALYFVLRLAVLQVATNSMMRLSPLVYLPTLARAFFRYIGELLWPLPLAPYLQHPWSDSITPAAVLAVLGCVAVAWLGRIAWRRKQLRALALGLGFIASLIPMANLIHISGPTDMGFVMAERFLYLPSVFFCLALGLAFDGSAKLPSKARAVQLALSAVLVLAIAGSAYATSKRGLEYRDDGTFMRAAIEHAPDAYLLQGRLGAFESLHGEHEAAIARFERAVELSERASGHKDPGLQSDLAMALHRAGRDREALALLEPLHARGVKNGRLMFALGDTLRALGRLDEAAHALEESKIDNASFADVHLALGRVEAARGDLPSAIAHVEDALRLAPDDAGLHIVRGDFERMRGEPDAAERLYRRALEVDPKLAHAHAALAAIRAERGDVASARSELQTALQLDPKLTDAHVALAVIDAREGKLQDAKQRLRRVLEGDPDHAEARLTLVRVHLQLGHAEDARAELREVRARHAGDARIERAADQISRALDARGYPP